MLVNELARRLKHAVLPQECVVIVHVAASRCICRVEVDGRLGWSMNGKR